MFMFEEIIIDQNLFEYNVEIWLETSYILRKLVFSPGWKLICLHWSWFAYTKYVLLITYLKINRYSSYVEKKRSLQWYPDQSD